MLAIGAGGLDVAVAMGGGPYYLAMPQMVKIELRPLWRLTYCVAVHEEEASGIPDFVRKVPADLIFLFGVENVLPQRGEVERGETDRVGSVLGNQIERLG